MKGVETAAGAQQRAPDAAEHILRARARALAAPTAEEAAPTEHIEVVTFTLAHETYGISLAYVREVYPLHDITPLPGTPPFVAGIVNVHGRVLSVIDIKKFFDLPVKGITDLNKVIVISNGIMEFGILADAILEVKAIPLDGIQSSLPTLTGIREEYLRGVTADRLVILDAPSLLTDSSIVVHEEIS